MQLLLLRAFFIIAMLALTACGWHLRGAYRLPPQMATTYVASSNQTGELVRQLYRNLRAAGVNPVAYPVEQAAVLKLRLSSGRRTVSIGPDGKAQEYEVYTSVRFSLSVPGSEFAVDEQQIDLTRDQVYNPLDVLAKGKEQQLLQNDMERQLAGMILERISAAYAGYRPGVNNTPD